MDRTKVLQLISHVSLDTFVGACVFYIIHFVFSMPIIWVGVVMLLSVVMRFKQINKQY
jgi:hypothetical protein